jgi:uncharacterized protein (DUF58 family)
VTAVTTAVAPATSFLDPTVLGRIGSLELLARVVVEGFINGLHRSPHLGASADFAQHRAYMPGDDIRRIDWRLYARSDKYFIKEYEAETNTNFIVILDVSPSMRYGAVPEEGRISKLTYGCFLAACLTYFLESAARSHRPGHDRHRHRGLRAAGAKQLQNILHTLDRIDKKSRDAKVDAGQVVAASAAQSSRRRCAAAWCCSSRIFTKTPTTSSAR